MKKEEFAELLSDINEKHITNAREDYKGKKSVWLKWGAAAACLCLVIGGGLMLNRSNNNSSNVPHPEQVQVVNPLMKVSSLEEMEKYLDFSVPVLEKEVDTYLVIVLDGYPECARILYADGSVFSMKYGTGDISGIYGGTLEREEKINGANVSFLSYSDTNYATWEKDGFTFSLSGSNDLEGDVKALTK